MLATFGGGGVKGFAGVVVRRDRRRVTSEVDELAVLTLDVIDRDEVGKARELSKQRECRECDCRKLSLGPDPHPCDSQPPRSASRCQGVATARVPQVIVRSA